MNMAAPKTLHDIQRLNGRLTSLSRFLARGAEKSLPFLRLLRGVASTKKATKAVQIDWDASFQEAFQELKNYLMEAPLLTSPRPGDTLLLYLAVTEEDGSSVLVREKEGNLQSRIYYVSNVLKGPAVRYSRIDKVGYTLLLSARRLRP